MALNKIKINMVSNKPPKPGKPKKPKKTDGKVAEIINKIKGKIGKKPQNQVKIQKPKKADGKAAEMLNKIKGIIGKKPQNQVKIQKPKKTDGKAAEMLNKIKGIMRKKLTWWQILIVILAAVLVISGIATAIILGTINGGDNPDGEDDPGAETTPGDGPTEGSGNEDDTPIIDGEITDEGQFKTDEVVEYLLCEYTELLSGNSVVTAKKEEDLPYGNKAYYVFIQASGEPNYDHSGEHTGQFTPERIKEILFNRMKNYYGYTDESLESCDVHVYEPVKFTRVRVSDISLEDGNVTVKYSAGAADGELSEEYTLNGTYTLTGITYTFSYSNMPENEHLLRVAEKLLSTAKYEYYAEYGTYVNTVTFGDSLVLKRIEGTVEGEIE